MYYVLLSSSNAVKKLNRFQHIHNALARAVAALRSSNSDHILKPLHWLKVQERIEYKVISTTCKLLQFSFPRYLRDFISSSRSIRSSTLVTLLQPAVYSNLKITNLFFRYAALHLCNKIPPTIRVTYQFDPSSSVHHPALFRRHALISGRLLTFLVAFSAFVLKLSFSQSLSISPQADYDHSLFDSHWRCSIGKFGKLRQPSWLLVRTIIIVILTSLTRRYWLLDNDSTLLRFRDRLYRLALCRAWSGLIILAENYAFFSAVKSNIVVVSSVLCHC